MISTQSIIYTEYIIYVYIGVSCAARYILTESIYNMQRAYSIHRVYIWRVY